MMKLNDEILDDFDTLIDKNKKYLLAFSGGPDSVYLLWMLSFYFKEELSEHVFLCYINYHDSEFVKEEEKIVDDYISKFHLKAIKDDVFYHKDKDKNFEEWARNYRYDLFYKIVQEKNLYAVLTAHQKTDVIETYLLQEKRNNLPLYYGLKKENVLYGLRIIRPLLTISKYQLTKELDGDHIPYYFDITNTYDGKQRNCIRKNLKEEDILSLNQIIEKKNNVLSSLYQNFSSYKKGMSFFDYDALSDEEKKRYCFFLLDQFYQGKNREGKGKLLFDFLKKKDSGVLSFDDDIFCYRAKDHFFISQNLEKITYSFYYDKEDIYENQYFKIDLRDPSLFNLKKLPVLIRNYSKGDMISTALPTKDVKKSLQKQGVAFYLIYTYPVFVQDDKIVCVPFYKDIINKKVPLELKMKYE